MIKMQLSGQKFGRLTVLMESERDRKRNRRMWLCKCDCGIEKIIPGISLTTGQSKSCGCLRKQNFRKRAKSLVGYKFSKLTVIRRNGETRTGIIKWLCVCDCGKEKTVIGTNLKRGLTTSCGCYSKESHLKHGLTKSPTYQSWQSMKDRCLNPNSDNYPSYGGRGITVDDRWIGKYGFENFIMDMGPRPKGTTLDRYPNNETGHYGPGNCRWGTDAEQARNKRSTRWVEYNGDRKVLSDWCCSFGITTAAFYGQLKRGKSESEAIEYYIQKRLDASNIC